MDFKAFENQYKLLLIGDSAVGKTSILLRFADAAYYENYVATIGIDYKIKNIVLDNKLIRLQIWDTAGQERFRTLTAAYFRKAMGILLVYDITSYKSFESVSTWLLNIKTNAPEDTQLILIGNKCDLEDQRTVTYKMGDELAKANDIKFFEVSAKENINIEESFLSLAKSIKNKQEGVDENAEAKEQSKETEISNPTNTHIYEEFTEQNNSTPIYTTIILDDKKNKKSKKNNCC